MKGLSLALPLSLASAAALPRGNYPLYSCVDFTIPISLNDVTTVVPPFPVLQDQYQATSLLNQITLRTPSTAQPQLKNLTANYEISAQYCQPAKTNEKTSTLQILTHGLGFNRSYWEFSLPDKHGDTQYNYINSAAAAGYSTLSYDRLGIFPSSMPDSYSETQGPVELAILVQITALVRQGKLSTHVPIPKKVIHVGHSYGSLLSNGVAAVAPELSDGVVMTAYTLHGQYQALFAANSNLLIASLADSERFPADMYPTGYITWPSQYANQYSFFAYPNFDPAVLAYAEATKQPFTIGEFISQPAVPVQASKFTGPVLFLLAEKDLIFCGSNCTGLVVPGGPEYTAFNATKDFEVDIVPGFGHGINLHLNASKLAYDRITEWAGRHGL